MSIKIIGTGHILQKSVDEVRKAIEEEKPEIVAVELDRQRFNALESAGWDLNQDRDGFSWKGASFPVLFRRFLGKIQMELGEKLGVSAGSDMKAAVFAARSVNAKLALIDRDIELTMNHLLSVPFREKINLLALSPEVDVMNIDNIIDGENIDKIMDEMKTKVPGIYSALVDERDQYMAYMIAQLRHEHPDANIIAVVGAGHKRGIEKHLQILYEIDMQKIMTLRKTSPLQIIPLVFVVFVAYVLMRIWFSSHPVRKSLRMTR